MDEPFKDCQDCIHFEIAFDGYDRYRKSCHIHASMKKCIYFSKDREEYNKKKGVLKQQTKICDFCKFYDGYDLCKFWKIKTEHKQLYCEMYEKQT